MNHATQNKAESLTALNYQYYDYRSEQIEKFDISQLSLLQAKDLEFYQKHNLNQSDAKFIIDMLKALSEFEFQCSVGQKNKTIHDKKNALIRVKTIGINRADILQSKGRYPLPKNSNPILGLELTGEILALPQNYRGTLKVGQEIMTLCEGGAYANYALVPVHYCMQIPKGLDLKQAAALPEALMTFWLNWRVFLTPYLSLLTAIYHSKSEHIKSANLKNVNVETSSNAAFADQKSINSMSSTNSMDAIESLNAIENTNEKLQQNVKNLLSTQNVLVRAASSGIGSLAVIIFASLGFNVYGSCQTPEKADKLREKLKSYPLKKIEILPAAQLAAHIEAKGAHFNLIFDMLGGNALTEAIQLAAPFAQIQHIAFLEKQTALLDLSLFLRKNLTLKASMLRPQEADIKIELVNEIERLLMPCLHFQHTPPLLNKCYEFSSAAIHLAHQTMLQNQHMGKCVLTLCD